MTPGVFKRVDGKGKTIGYVCVFRAGGRQRKRHARTYDEAKRVMRQSEADRGRGQLQERTAISRRPKMYLRQTSWASEPW